MRAPLRCSDAYIEGFIAKNQGWIERHRAERLKEKHYTPEEVAELRRRAKEFLPARAAYFAARMGVKPAAVKITSARTRYGSCNSKGNICYSLYLMDKSPRAVDYVVVHELAHLRQLNHSAAFYEEIERILPDYKERIKELKEKNQ